jgi:hypothetical protein
MDEWAFWVQASDTPASEHTDFRLAKRESAGLGDDLLKLRKMENYQLRAALAGTSLLYIKGLRGEVTHH